MCDLVPEDSVPAGTTHQVLTVPGWPERVSRSEIVYVRPEFGDAVLHDSNTYEPVVCACSHGGGLTWERLPKAEPGQRVAVPVGAELCLIWKACFADGDEVSGSQVTAASKERA